MNPKNFELDDCTIYGDMSDLVNATSSECISTTLLFNIISFSGMCLLIEHDTNVVSMKHNKMIFTKSLRTIFNFFYKNIIFSKYLNNFCYCKVAASDKY